MLDELMHHLILRFIGEMFSGIYFCEFGLCKYTFMGFVLRISNKSYVSVSERFSGESSARNKEIKFSFGFCGIYYCALCLENLFLRLFLRICKNKLIPLDIYSSINFFLCVFDFFFVTFLIIF